MVKRLIAKAILSTQERRMILSEIYQWIQLRYPYFSSRGPGWRNSIRHNLSLNDCFIKVGRAANGKGHYWGIHPANLKDFLSGDFRRRRAQRKVRRALGLSRPDDKLHKQDDDDDDDDEDDDEDRDGDVGVDDQDTRSPNSPSLPPQLFDCLHPHISTYQSMRSTLTNNSSPTLNTHPLTNSHISTFDRLTDSPTKHNHSTNNPTNITTPLLFNPSHFTSTHNSHFLPHHHTLINASSASRLDTSTTSTQSIQSLDLTNPPLKSNCNNDTLMELFYINLMHLLNNHQSYIQSHLQHELSTSDKHLFSTTQSTTNTTTSNHTTHTSTTTNQIPSSTTVIDHHSDDNVHYTNSSHPSFDPVRTRSHSPAATSQPTTNVSFNVVNLIDHPHQHQHHHLNHSDVDVDVDVGVDNDVDSDVDNDDATFCTMMTIRSDQQHSRHGSNDDKKTEVVVDELHNNEIDIPLELHSTNVTINPSLSNSSNASPPLDYSLCE
ncbi:unnamed protein product [Schistosoma turkestanicum]|nr:unnamed protein product [Schistosoma turkestanicum]